MQLEKDFKKQLLDFYGEEGFKKIEKAFNFALKKEENVLVVKTI